MTEDGERRRGANGDRRPARLSHPHVLVALIGALGGVAVAVVTGVFTVLAGWVQLGQGSAPGTVSRPTATVTTFVTTTVTAPGKQVKNTATLDETGATYLSDLNPIEEEGSWRDGEVRLEDQEFDHGMVASSAICDSYRTYSLGGEYQRFRSTAAFSDVTGGAESADFAVYLDGVPVLSDIVVLGEQLAVDVDVSGADEFQIFFDHHCGGSVLGLGDPRLLVDEK